jgi:murein DD-endopeptidase MepM/ murein hydrolase activator NlpD
MHLMSFYSTPYISKQREENILKKLNIIRSLWFVAGISLGVLVTYWLAAGGHNDVAHTTVALEGTTKEMSMEAAAEAGEALNNAPAQEMLIGDAPKETDISPITTATPAVVSWPQKLDLTVAAGDTLIDMMIRHGMDKVTAHRLCKEINKTYKLRQLRPGMALTLVLDQDTTRTASVEEIASAPPALLHKLTIYASKLLILEVTPKGGDAYDIRLSKKKLVSDNARIKAVIHNSLYSTAEKQGVPREAISQLIKNFSYEVDFQRDIKAGDRLDMMYETQKTEDGTVIDHGDIVYAMLETGGEIHKQYRFLDEHGLPSYYNEKGESIIKRLLRTPIDGARLASGFGMRMHPILGYSKMHTGIDFAAARGTPIYASGDGVVTFAGYNGSYGKFVRIQHNETFSTAYAHAHRIDPAVRKGAFVHQGQVIAYVGTTGRSTGPHLHYEIIKNGAPVNPMLVKMTGSDKLQGSRLIAFRQYVDKINTQLARLDNEKKLASLR